MFGFGTLRTRPTGDRTRRSAPKTWPGVIGPDDPAANPSSARARLISSHVFHLRRSMRLVEPAAVCHAVMISGRSTGDNTIIRIAIGPINDMGLAHFLREGISCR
jgi:hypothetical protein